MGDGAAGLILDELESVIDVDGIRNPVFAEQASRQAEERTAELEARQRALDRGA